MRTLLLVLLAATPAPLAAAPRPNILFILTDDHAAHAIGAYGSGLLRTPRLDRLAGEGMLFANCFVTNSICAPSRASILTGKYSHRHGVTVFNRFDGSQPTFPKMLRAAGYQTALMGKWHLESDPTGFDRWCILPGQGDYVDPVFIEDGKRTRRTGYATDLITDLSLEFLERRDPSRPFLLLTHHKAPHRNWVPAPRHEKLLEDTDIPVPDTFDDDHRGRSAAAAEAEMRIERDFVRSDLKEDPPPGLAGAELKRWKHRRYLEDYLRCVTAVDENVGRLLDGLDRLGLRESTIVIYTSDQGFFLGEHGWYDKRFMYEESLRMPLLVRFPGMVRAGSRSESMAINVDFAPTLLELAGVEIPADIQGRSLAPLLRGETPADWRRSMYYRYYHYPEHHRVHPHLGVRTERWKLIHYDLLDEWELFDLRSDPIEMRNLAADPAHRAKVDELRAEMARLQRELGDDGSYLLPQSLIRPVDAPPGPILRFGFETLEGGYAPDGTGRGHDGVPLGVRPARGLRGMAARFVGDGSVEVEGSRAPDPSRRAILAGAWARPEVPEGILLAHGGPAQGYSLHIQDGLPVFAVRSGSSLRFARAKAKVLPGRWTHLAGEIGSDGHLRLWVDGRPTAEVRGVLIERKPADGFCVGDDPGSPVNLHPAPPPWRGLIEDVRVYQGPLDPATLREWARREGSF